MLFFSDEPVVVLMSSPVSSESRVSFDSLILFIGSVDEGDMLSGWNFSPVPTSSGVVGEGYAFCTHLFVSIYAPPIASNTIRNKYMLHNIVNFY